MIKVSKIVYVRQKEKSTKLPGYNPVNDIQKIGSGLKHRDVLRGLDPEEEAKYLPKIIGVQPHSEKWDERTREYWSNISVVVPYGDKGLPLEVGMEYPTQEDADNNKNGTPINISEYIIWRYCLVYGDVANSYEDIDKSPKIRFYLFSKMEKVNKEFNDLKTRQKAYTNYLATVGTRTKVDMMLRILIDLVTDPDINIGNYRELSDSEKDIQLERIAIEYPVKFNSVCEDENLEMRAFIEECIGQRFLTRLANTDTIMYGDNTILGNNMAETIAQLGNPKNEGILTELKAKIKYWKIPTKPLEKDEDKDETLTEDKKTVNVNPKSTASTTKA